MISKILVVILYIIIKDNSKLLDSFLAVLYFFGFRIFKEKHS